MRHSSHKLTRDLPGLAVFAVALLLAAPALFAQSLATVTAERCLRGDCVEGEGAMEFDTPWGKGRYVGGFQDGEFHGQGRLEIPISFLAEEIYTGRWENGVREGRGKHWNGRGNLYIGQWQNNRRHGQGTYVFNLPEWHENRHTEFWFKDNTENYTGEFVDDHYHGQGAYRWANGEKFVGGFFASEKHGPGTFYYQTGTARRQLWNFGDFVR